jgi:hypothetical protein
LAQCEPTVVCEGHRFRVYPVPPKAQFTTRDKASLVSQYGALPTRYRACVTAIPDLTLSELPGDASAAERADAYQQLCAVMAGLRDFLKTHGGYSRELGYRLASIPIPAPDNKAFLSLYEAARLELDNVRDELRNYCRCSILLPPSPEPVDDDCVPLATVTVRGDDCKIINICNFGVRHIAFSVPALAYWLSLTPIGHCLGTYLAARCCGERFDVRECYRWLAVGMTGLGTRTAGIQPSNVIPTEFFSEARSGQPEPRLDLTQMPHADIERSDLWRESAFDDLILPLVEAFARAPTEAAAAEEAVPAEPGEMRDELVTLRQILRRQQARIDDLIDRMDQG